MPTCVANEHGHVCCVETQGPFNMVVSIPIPITTKWVVHINTRVQHWARVSISISEPHVLFLSVRVSAPDILNDTGVLCTNIQCLIRRKWLRIA